MSLTIRCGNCGLENPPGFAYCGGCGTKLTSLPHEPEETRREVAVLFADVVGFTSLAERTDAEDVRAIIGDLLSGLTAHVYAFGGRIDMYAGDALMATFGAPVAHENDALLACRAALAMHATPSTPLGAASPLRIRIGINLGEVIFGRIAGSERFTVMGDAVNVASRLQTSAAPDTVYVSATVAGRCAPWLLLEPLGSLQVKNRAQPVEAFRLIGERAEPQPDRGIPGPEAWVDRREELERVRRWLHDLSDEAAPDRILALTGDGGIGKSRLWREARTLASRGPSRALSVSYSSIAADLPLSSVRLFLLAWLGLPPRAPGHLALAAARERLTSLGIGPSGEEAAVLGLVLSGVPDRALADRDPSERLRSLPEVVGRVLAREEEICPLLVELDNYQWTDRLGRDALLKATAKLRRGGCVVVCRDREEVPQTIPFVALSPLSPADSTELARHHLGAGLACLAERIATLAGGNPYYIEELVRHLRDTGHVVPGPDGSSALMQPLDAMPLPPTLTAFITQKIDSCGRDARTALAAACILGEADEELVAKVSAVATPAAALSELERRCLITRRRDGQVAPSCGLVSSALLHALLRPQRQRLHSLAADVLLQRQAEGEDHLAGIISHLEGAARTSELVSWLQEAAVRAVNQGLMEDGLAFLDRAIVASRLVGDSQRAIRVQLRKVEVLLLAGRPADAISVLDALPPDMDPPGHAESQVRRFRAYVMRGDLQGATALIEGCVEGEDYLPTSVRGELHTDLAQLFARTGQWERAREEATATLELGRAQDDRMTQAMAHNILGVVAMTHRQISQARGHLEEALALYRSAHRTRNVASITANLGLLYLQNEDSSTARSYLREAVEVARHTGNAIAEASATNNLGIAHMWMAAWTDAEACFAAARGLYARIGSPPQEGSALLNQATAHRLQGRWAEAALCLDERNKLMSPTADCFHDETAMRDQVLLSYQSGRIEEMLGVCCAHCTDVDKISKSLALFLRLMAAVGSLMLERGTGLDENAREGAFSAQILAASERIDVFRAVLLDDLWKGRATEPALAALVDEVARSVRDAVPSLEARICAAVAGWNAGGGEKYIRMLEDLCAEALPLGMPFHALVADLLAVRARRLAGLSVAGTQGAKSLAARAERVGNPVLKEAVEMELRLVRGESGVLSGRYRGQI